MTYSPIKKSLTACDVTALGSENVEPMSEEERNAFVESGFHEADHEVLTYYNRVVKKTCRTTVKPTKSHKIMTIRVSSSLVVLLQ